MKLLHDTHPPKKFPWIKSVQLGGRINPSNNLQNKDYRPKNFNLKKSQGNIKNTIRITIKHLEINQISAVNNL